MSLKEALKIAEVMDENVTVFYGDFWSEDDDFTVLSEEAYETCAEYEILSIRIDYDYKRIIICI